jgi:hypothetical protein
VSTYLDNEQLVSEDLQKALELLQQAQAIMHRAEQRTTESGLIYRLREYSGTLSLIRESGNVQLNKLRDLFDN